MAAAGNNILFLQIIKIYLPENNNFKIKDKILLLTAKIFQKHLTISPATNNYVK